MSPLQGRNTAYPSGIPTFSTAASPERDALPPDRARVAVPATGRLRPSFSLELLAFEYRDPSARATPIESEPIPSVHLPSPPQHPLLPLPRPIRDRFPDLTSLSLPLSLKQPVHSSRLPLYLAVAICPARQTLGCTTPSTNSALPSSSPPGTQPHPDTPSRINHTSNSPPPPSGSSAINGCDVSSVRPPDSQVPSTTPPAIHASFARYAASNILPHSSQDAVSPRQTFPARPPTPSPSERRQRSLAETRPSPLPHPFHTHGRISHSVGPSSEPRGLSRFASTTTAKSATGSSPHTPHGPSVVARSCP
ncbi:hypothetical protein C8Q80DRAFT_1270845 [Daedaleopsis nitida]|nr:hypothetical protein C8Q80DRAFT_1270845 [Daedaleopsis nitida]